MRGALAETESGGNAGRCGPRECASIVARRKIGSMVQARRAENLGAGRMQFRAGELPMSALDTPMGQIDTILWLRADVGM
jgi:hypothetical protein